MKRSLYGAGSVVRKGNRWQGRFSVDGVPQKVSLGVRREVDPKGLTEAQARKKLREHQASFKLPNPQASTPFPDVANAHITRQRLRDKITELTESQYRNHLHNIFEPEFKDKGIGDPKQKDIESFQDKLLRKYQPETVRLYMSILSGIFRYAVKEEMRDENPCVGVERPKKGKGKELRVLYSAELKLVIEQIPGDGLGDVERRLYPFSAKTGLRQSESAKKLRWRHIDFVGRNINVYDGKGGKNRVVPLARDVAEMLSVWRTISPWSGDNHLVFAHPATGKPISASTILKRFQMAVLRVGVGEFRYTVSREGKVWEKWPLTTFHDLRHSFGTSLAMAGVPLPKIQKWLGHSRIETTMIYINFVPSEDEADVLDRALGSAVASVPLG
jgi:integrase